ncbi:MAG TPA: adenylate/guanylate cyclase domain-containing protein [Clostridiales bacterium]|nr:adenylate/guanylate cyclase domain-containing protein [Clostridiales bacterium]
MSESNKKLIFSLIGALVVTFLCGKGLFRRFDIMMQDALYQKRASVPGDIVLIGIDEDDIKQYGPYNTWDRNMIASVLDKLAEDPDPNHRPAAVAIDALYAGTTDPSADTHLAKAAEKLGNVIVASTAYFGTDIRFGSDSVVVDTYSVVDYAEPYEELKKVTTQGHINTMSDDDGVVRHALLYVEPDGRRVYSMAYQAASMYAKKNGYSITMPPTNERGQYFVQFIGKPGDFSDGVSIHEVLDGTVKPEFFAGKIVMIGPYAAAFQDSYFTAIDKSSRMYGVEIQANIVQFLLDGNYKESVPDYIQLMVLWIVCFAFFYFCNNKKLRVSVPLLILFLLLGIGGSMMLYSGGYITHAVWIPAGVFMLFIITVASHYIRAAIAKQNVTKTFERYVAPSIVNEILKEGTDSLKLGGKLCDIAVLFVDIRGFTTMSERLSPEEVVHILNQYLSMTSACIEKNKGTLDKFVGDATMAFWGAPLPEEDPVYLAALTALDIVKGAEELSKKLKEEINEELHVGVGVHYGPAVVGNMGSEKRMDYTAIGDTVNTSARLEANAPGGMVYISRAVADKLEGRMRFTSLGDSIKLKGKAEGFEVLRLEGPVEE